MIKAVIHPIRPTFMQYASGKKRFEEKRDQISTFDISEEHGPPPCSGRSQASQTILGLHPCVLARTLAPSSEKDSVSEFVQLLESLADYIARRGLN